MAVEIPVYVDIQGAFNRAQAEIPKEMPKLERIISKNALKIPVYVGGGFKTIDDMLRSQTVSAKQLKQALHDIEYQFKEVSEAAAGKKSTPALVNNLAKAYGLVKQRLTGVYDANSVNAMRLQHEINRVIYKIKEMNASLSTMAPGSAMFNKTNYELQIQRKRLAELTVQQMKYKAGIDASTSAYQKQTGIVKQLTGYFSGLYAAHTLLRFVKQVRDVTGELEYQRVALGHLLQDEQFGNELFAKTIEAAKESPFRIGQLVTYTKQLAAYRIEQENLFDTTQRLADISAGLGVDMNRLILAYGQVRAASVLRGQELRQFTEAGIPLVELLAEKFQQLGREGTTTADVFKLISERAVPFEYIKEIFEELTDAGGQFYKMQETQAKTLKGRWEKLKDAYDQALMSIGETETFQKMNDQVLSILNGLAKNLNGVVRILNAGSIAWAAYWLATKSGLSYGVRLTGMFLKEYGAVKTLTYGIAGLTAAFKKMWAVLKSNWVGLAISSLAGIVTYFTTFGKKTKEATEIFSEMQQDIAKMREANKDFTYEKGLIAAYQELADKTNRSSAENKRLAITMDELERLFPSLAVEIHHSNIPLEKRIELLNEAAESAHNLAVEEAGNRLKTQEGIIRGLEDQKAAALARKEAAEAALRSAELEERIQRQREVDSGVEPGTTTYGKKLAQDTKDAAIEAKNAEKSYDDIARQLALAVKEAKELRDLINPSEKTKDWYEWQKQIQKVQENMMKIGDSPVFTSEEIGNLSSVYDLFGKLKKRSKDLKESINGMREAFSKMTAGTDAYIQMSNDIASAERTKAIADAIQALFGFDFSSKGGSDNRLSKLKKDISEITNAYKKYIELRKHMPESSALEEIGMLFPQLKGFDPTLKNTIDRIQGLLKKYKGPKDKVYLEMERAINTEVSNLNFDYVKDTLTKELKRISDDIKHSETARNFYKNILDLTGDEDIATNMTVSVYGDIGSEFKERLRKELNAALSSFDDRGNISLWNRMREALASGDFNTILQYLDRFPEEWQKRLKEMAISDEKYNADLLNNLVKTLQKAKTYGEKQAEIAKKSAERIAEINSLSVDQSIKDDLLKQNAKKAAEETARVQYEAFKESPMYIELFENLDGASTRMLKNMRENLDNLKGEWKNLSPRELRELQNRIDELDKQLATRNPFTSLVSSWKEYNALTKNVSRREADETATGLTRYANLMKDSLEAAKQNYEITKNKPGVTQEEINAAKETLDIQAEETDEAIKSAEAAQKTANGYREALKLIQDAADGMQTWAGYINESLDGIGEIVATFASDEVSESFNIVSQGIGKTLSGLTTTASSITRLMAGDLTAIPSLIQGIASLIDGVFGTALQMKINRLNRQIEDQQDLLDSLARSYERMERAMEKAFGSDYIYNYNKQLENLAAQQAAYEEQARLEREKGKKADKSKIKDYENSAMEAGERLVEMQSKLAEFFSGTDLTSAAEDFANSWIEAYKEFGNTTDAMSEKFNDMIQSMITRSLGAKIMESILRPLFDEIDTMARSEGALSAQEIASIANMAPEYVGRINAAMTTLMNQLAAAGYNVRQTAGSFTGISRDIAGASEESINGLAAGVNTQNFYISHIDMTVTAILSTLTGGDTSTASSGGAEVTDPYKDQMLIYVSSLPQVRDDVYAIRSMLEKVIRPNGTPATHYVSSKI